MKELKVKFQRTLAVLLSVMVAICSTPTVAYAYEYAEGDQITLKFDAGTEAGYTNVPSGYVYSDNVYTTEEPVEYGPDVITPSVTLLPEPDDIPNGKVFVGWRSTGDGDFDPGTVDLSSLGNSITGEDHHYECVFTAVYADVYGISYDENGGNAPTSENPESWNSNENEFTLNAPTREGYDFQGWFLAENTEFTGEPITNAVTVLNSTLFDAIDGNSISLVAKWEAKTYTITLTGLSNVSANSLAALKTIGFSMNDNDAPTSATTTKTIEDSLTIPEIEKPGARFIKWDDGNGETVDDKTVTLAAGDIKSELEYQAVFADEHTLTLTGLTGIDASSVTTLEELGFTINGDTATKVFTALDPEIELPRLNKTGAKFGGWYIDNPASADTQIIVDTTVTEDVIYHAKFTVRYSIIFMDGDTELIDLRSSYASGQAVIDLDALPPKTSYTSNGWILEGDESKTLHSPGELALADLGIGSTLQEGNLVFNASYIPTPYTITLTGLVGVSENSIEALEELGFTLNEQKTEATITKTVEDSLTIPAVTPKAHKVFNGWIAAEVLNAEASKTVVLNTGDITDNMSYKATFATAKNILVNFQLAEGAFMAADIEGWSAFGYEAGVNDSISAYVDDDRTAISNIPAPRKDGHVFAGWTVDGSSEKVMSYTLPVPNNQTISLTANWITGTAGETTIVVAGSGGNTISANSVAAIKEALDSTLDNNQTAITKLVIEEDLNDAHAGSSLDTEISKEFTGATTLTKTYVEIDITQYITSASENSVEREINDLGRVVDITYTPTNGVENLRAIVREHGDPKTYTRFRELAAAPTELEDGTYFIDDPVVHIYTRYFSAYAFAYAANVFTVSFDSNGGDQTYDSIQTNKLGTLPTPTRTGYWEFVKWTYSDGSTATTGDDITEDTVLTAVWQDASAGKITGVSLNKASLRLYQGQTYTLIATVNPEDIPNKNITWTSSNANIAIVGAGTVEAKNVGTCTITAISAVDATKFATCEVTVLKSEIIDTDESGKAIDPGNKAIDENGQAKVWVAGLDTVGYFYTGYAIKPVVHVYKGYELLKPGVDYTLSYKNNTKVSTNVTSDKKKPQIIIKMKGRHSGSETVYFTILPMPIDRLSASNSTLSAVYKSGKKNQLKPTVMYEGAKVKYGKKDLSLKWFTTDANGNATNTETTCIEPGLYAVKVFAGSSGNFVALTDDGYQIATIDVSSKVQFKDIKLNGFKSSLPYSGGSAVKQPATLNYQSKALVEGTDYTVTYENNYNIGKATVTYEAIKDAHGNYTGKYAGKITRTYKITGKYALKDATIVLDKDSYDFANAAIKPAVTATIMTMDNEGKPELRVLTQGKDYTVSYKYNKAVAAANAIKAPQVIIKGKGDFTGSVVKNFAITKADLSSLVLTIPDKPYSKKADAYKSVKIQFLNQSYKDLKLKANKDYTATYTTSDGSNTPAAGQTVSVTLTAKETSSYTGSVTGSYRIVNTPDIKKAKVVINPNAKGKTTACVYTGAEIEPGRAGQPKVVVTMSKKQLTQGTDFEILSYYNNVTPGKSAIMVIRGIGSYSGVRAVKFTISNKPVSSCWGGVFGQN